MASKRLYSQIGVRCLPLKIGMCSFWAWVACQLVVAWSLTPGIDYPTCIDNFDIHKDKIIRTEDSRQLGAKYLNELELTSRDQCLRVCCQTENCDVFVFEEKSPGSCYLFHCGGPENFKCKFTKHHNYTSGILSAAQHLAELEAQIRLTKHENELTRLRKPDTSELATPLDVTEKVPVVSPEIPQIVTQAPIIPTNPPIVGVSVANSPAILTVNPNVPPAEVPRPPPAVPTNRQCSHFQFECRETHECIGIYNACDGVEQCADGSDEAPELKCPQQEVPQAAQPPLLPPPPPVKLTSTSVTENTVKKVEMPQIPPVMNNNPPQIHSVTKITPPGSIPAPVASPEGLMMTKVGPPPMITSDNHLELMQPAQSLQQIPLPPPQPPPYNVNHLRLYNQENQAIPSENVARQQNEPPFDEKTSIPFNTETDLSKNLWQKGGVPPNYPLVSIPSPSPPMVALSKANSHIFTHKGNGLVVEKGRYRENPPHHVDYNNVVDTLGQDYSKFTLGLSPSVNNMVESPMSPFRPLTPTIYNPNNWPRVPIVTQNMHGVYRPAVENEQEQMDPLRNRLTALEMTPGVNVQPQPQMPVDYVYEESPGKLHSLEAAAAMAAVMNQAGSSRISTGTSQRMDPLDSSIKDFGNVVHDINAFQEKLKQNYPEKLKSPITVSKELERKVTKLKPKPTISTVLETATTIISQSHTQKTVDERPAAAAASLEARFSEEELINESQSSPSGAILSLALGLCLTGILAGLVGCRLRLVRKRLRRIGKSSYAHDADFLVNGMYL